MAAAAVVVLVVAVVYLLRLDRVAGLVVDDAWYILLGQALSQGQGFRLTSSAVAEILPNVPPGFPFILSVLFRLNPHFPENVPLLKSVSIIAMAGVGLASFWYAVRCRRLPWQLGAAIAVAVVVTPAFVFLATSTVMAECVFTLAQLAAVIALDHACASDRHPRRRRVVVAAAIAAAAMLIRSTGIALIAAGVLYLLNQRRWREALLFGATVLLLLAPWLLYARAHAPTTAQRLEHGGSIAFAYADSMRLRAAGTPSSGQATLADVRARVVENLTNVFGRDMTGMLAPAFLRGPDESGEEVVSIGGTIGVQAGSMGNATPTLAISFVLSVIAIVGYVRTVRERAGVPELLVPLTIAMAVLVPFWTFRYVLPVAPFIVLYIVEGLRTTASDRWRLARVFILLVIGFDAYDQVRYILDLRGGAGAHTVEWVADGREVDEVLAWMKDNLVDDGAVAASNPGLVYLRTGRKGVAMDDWRTKWHAWKAHGIRYLVALRPLDLPDRSAVPYRVLYQTARHKLWVIEF